MALESRLLSGGADFGAVKASPDQQFLEDLLANSPSSRASAFAQYLQENYRNNALLSQVV